MKKRRNERHRVGLGAFAVVSIVAFATLALVISGVVLILRFNESIQKTAVTTTEQLVQQAEKTIDSYLTTMIGSMESIERITRRSETEEQQNENLRMLFDLQNDLVSVVIYNKFGDILTCVASEDDKLKQDTTANLSYRYEGTQMEDGYIVSPPHVNNLFTGKYKWVVTISKEVYSSVYGQPVKASMDVGFSSLASYIDDVRIGEKGYCYIINENGELVYHPKQQLIYKGLKTENTAFVQGKKPGSYVTKNIIYGIQSTGNASWTIVGVSYVDELILSKQHEALVFSGAVILFSSVVFLLVGLFIRQWFSRPVKKLIRSMTDIERGVSSTEEPPGPLHGFSEICDLDDSFREMVKKIQSLMEHIKNEEEILRKVEFNALQEQINPHFLYNTLDSILWMSQKGENKEVSKMVSALAKLLRISLSKGREVITIGNELKHVESYLIIQSTRYKDQFTYEFLIDEGLLDKKCLKLTLQPFVENAIYHGIDRMVDEGKITISGHRDGGDIVLSVKDNGLGMDEDSLSRIFTGESKSEGGFGVKNVNDRLRIYFGSEYGVTIQSELDVGTEVFIRFPCFESDRYEREESHGKD